MSGPVTLANATRLLDEGRLHLAEGARTVDLGEVTELDSALLALILAWLRDARAAKRELSLANVPQSLQTLARLYGVEELLPVAR
ncbi:MAG TPA: STAS domain-containing protein [Burkholderiales bacterium]|nr:STAS domain-containing protein [Burkholderiales bacterium]